MILLDIRTLFFATTVTSVLLAGAMVVLWRAVPEERACRYWAAGAVLSVIGFSLIFLRGTVPDFLSIPVSNTLLVGSYALSAFGIAVFTGSRMPYFLGGFSPLVMFLAAAYFLYVEPDVGWRIVALSALMGLMAYWNAYSLLVHVPAGMGLTQRLAGALFLAHGIALALRAVLTLTGSGPVVSLFSATTLEVANSILTLIVITGVTFCFAAMTAQRLHLHLEHAASHDALTGLPNRCAIEEMAGRETARAARHGYPLSVLMMDLDRFKAVNDTYGHEAGDAVLKAFAEIAKKNLRQGDVIGRFGGEEFLALLPVSDREAAIRVAERIRTAVSSRPVSHAGSAIPLTVSIGVAVSDADSVSSQDAIRAADSALYAAKRGGRNQVIG
mgnify:CR=1 FL=1